MTKSELRTHMKQIRRHVDDRGSQEAAVTEAFLNSEAFRQHDLFLCYYPMGTEWDMKPLMMRLHEAGKALALPRMTGPHEMEFVPYTPGDPLKEAAFHVLEPVGGPLTVFEKALVLLPGLAFGRDGSRLGYGGGYYDTFLAAHPLDTAALIYRQQLLDSVPTEPWDIRIRQIFTDQECVIHDRLCTGDSQ